MIGLRKIATSWRLGVFVVIGLVLATLGVLTISMGAFHSLGGLGTKAPSPSSKEIPVGDLPGWHQIFADDFNRDELGADWGAYDGTPGGDPYSMWDPSHVKVGESKLVLEGYQQDGRWVTGGVSNFRVAQTYGKWEVRFRADRSDEITYHFLLWPKAPNWPPEIDFLENGGGDRSEGSGYVHFVETDGNGTSTNQQVGRTVTADFSSWQTVGVEWLPGSVTYTLNGKPWGSITGDFVPSEPMWLGLQAQAGGCERKADFGVDDCPVVGIPAQANVEIDWVVAYAAD